MARASALNMFVVVAMVMMSSCTAAGAMAAGGAGYGSMSTVYGSGAGAGGGYYGAGEAAVRRVLGDTTSVYISYAALSANAVPCSTAGASYYDCSSSGAANPYTRSCTTITLCARDTS